MSKFVFITGGVVSSLGKGIAAASIGRLLEERGIRVTLQKLDPYLNVDPGTMSPFQHGEVYVTEDGAETDLDLGHYERFTTAVMSRANNLTSGQVYESILSKERKGLFLGKTVQVVPHVTNEIKNRIKHLAKATNADVVLTEIGGTVGDIEGLPFLEAIRQMRFESGRDSVLYIHLTLVPYIRAAKELKTKPTQHSVGKLREIGIQPDILICRTERPLSRGMKQKIALFCNVDEQAVIEGRDIDSVYKIPYLYHAQGLDDLIIKLLHLQEDEPLTESWKARLENIRTLTRRVRVAVVGKYIDLQDAYKSIYEALTHAAFNNGVHLDLMRVDAERIESGSAENLLQEADGILVPGGFGTRGIEGKIRAIEYARKAGVPFFGICLGMQCAVIEFGRHVCGIEGASSTEFDEACASPVICLLESQKTVVNKGGTMRLGAYPCKVKPQTQASRAYGGKELIQERHRHRFEFNPGYMERYEKHGMIFSGLSPDGHLAEIVELADHPWFVACQFHPEFKSKIHQPHPLFHGFLQACVQRSASSNAGADGKAAAS